MATGKPIAEEAKVKVGEASSSFRNKEYTHANGLLDQAEPLIKAALADDAKPTAPAPPAAGGADAAAWQQVLAAVEPRYQQALQGNPPEANKLARRHGVRQRQGRGQGICQGAGGLENSGTIAATGQGGQRDWRGGGQRLSLSVGGGANHVKGRHR